MIREAMIHFPGIGKKVLQDLHQQGIRDWAGLLKHAKQHQSGHARHQALLREIERCEKAQRDGDLAYLIRTFASADHWRILAAHFDRASYFDIETSGMGPESYITLIVCYHKNQLFRYFRGENLTDFLELLDDIDLLVSFNGSQFDVPRVEDAFHIPKIPCPHIDLRWPCHHQGYKGGLKSIERELAIARPPDLIGVDGEEAVWLWESWDQDGDRAARDKLERYCAADVISLKCLAARLLQIQDPEFSCSFDREIWELMDTLEPRTEIEQAEGPVQSVEAEGEAVSPLERRLRTRWNAIKNRDVSV
jgi:uncharacterized protein YprB with RNaseH-like and TPR domain